MSDVEIRPGTPQDIPTLRPLWMEMVEHHRSVVVPADIVRPAPVAWEIRRVEYEGWMADGSGFFLVADDGEPAGYVFCRVLGSTATFDLGDVRGELESLVVADRARGRGIGTALIDAARVALKERACTRWVVAVAAANPGAIAVYERAGFRPWVQEMLGEL